MITRRWGIQMTMKRIAKLMITCLILAGGCQTPTSVQKEIKTATGILSHFPSNVRTGQAWYGHNFMVGGVPVQPTTVVSEKNLLKCIGKKVSVSGTWNPGFVWKPTDEERNMQMPVNPDKDGPSIRGDGIMVDKLEMLNE